MPASPESITPGLEQTARGSAAPEHKVPYLPGLDGMRALAVVVVMIYHADSDWLKGGFIGVEVFFVISGYLITLLLLTEHERTGSISMRDFWVRRLRRLLPALYTMMLLLIAWTALFEPDSLGKLRGDVIAGLLYVSNWYQIFIGAGYSASNDFAPLRHLWSLAVEEQFYFIWPIVIAAVLRKGPLRRVRLSFYLFGAALAVAAVVAWAYDPGPISSDPTNTPDAYWEIGDRFVSKADALYLSTISRSTGLLLGAAFAMIWRPTTVAGGPLRRWQWRTLADLFAAGGLVLLGAMCWYVGFINTDGENLADPLLFQGGFFVAGLASLMVIAAVTHRSSLTSKALSLAPILWIGTRSYGLYLYHWPIYQIARGTTGAKMEIDTWIYCLLITGAITELSYRYIETPLRRGWLGEFWRSQAGRVRQRQGRGIAFLVGFGLVGLVIAAGATLATAELRQNEVAERLDESALATCSVLEGDCEDDLGVSSQPEATPTPLPTPTPAPTPTVAPAPPDVATNATPEATPTPTATPEPTPVPTYAPAKKRLAIGDSVMLGAAQELRDAGFAVDAEEARSFVRGIDIAEALVAKDKLPNELVVHLGTNGPIGESQMEEFMSLISPVRRILLVKNDVDRDYAAGNNELFEQVAEAYPNVAVLKWKRLLRDCPGECLYRDDLHLTPEGAVYYTAVINAVLSDPNAFPPVS